MFADLAAKIADRLGPKGVVTDAGELAPYLAEWRGKMNGNTPFAVLPSTTEEAAAAVRLCAEAGAKITPQGGNTGLVGGQIPNGEILFSLKRMNRIREIDAANDSLVAEAGVILANVQQAAAESNRLFPLSLGSEGSATIGGLISTNAGGVHVLRYGMMRDLVLGVEAVLPDGRVLHGLKALRKDNTGYDLKQLFIGAEGTLGLVTAASLKLFSRPAARETVLAAAPSPAAALDLLHRLKQATGAVAAFEVMNRLAIDLTVKNIPNVRSPLPAGAAFGVLAEFEAAHPLGLRESIEGALENALQANEVETVLIAENAGQARDFWALREHLPMGHRLEGMQVNHDISVPVSKTPDFIQRAGAAALRCCPGARIVAFGHMGDGNLHYSVLQPEGAASFPSDAIALAVNEIAVALGGSISAEHGIGAVRQHDLARFKDSESLTLMRTLKRALDPMNVMNPRVMFTS
jgi:FAD/FMN-containing dehydrogenase